jgi:hypothetical protein
MGTEKTPGRRSGTTRRKAVLAVLATVMVLGFVCAAVAYRYRGKIITKLRELRDGQDEPLVRAVEGPDESSYPVVGPKAEGHPRILLTPANRAAIVARAKAGSASYRALEMYCDARVGGQVEWHDGDDTPALPNIGEGYQGEDYFQAIVSLSLCYQIAKDVAPARASGYGETAREVLRKMSETEGVHAPNPLTDSGYVIRFYGVGMALGFDWLYDLLEPSDKARVVTALDRFVTAYEKEGFGREHPQGNYFAGYYAAKALAALATEGDDPNAPRAWEDWLTRVHGGFVQPFYAKYLEGGGWPEGWSYGALATVNMTWPVIAAKTAKGIDLLRNPKAPYAFPLDQAKNLLHFSWPNRASMDDRGDMPSGDNPSQVRPGTFALLSWLLDHENDPLAAPFHAYAREVRARAPMPAEPWLDALFWDEDRTGAPFDTQPLSYLARGMQTVAMRSSWADDAVWASFTSGPYVNNPASGEMYFDQGSFAIVRGGTRFVANTVAALYTYTPGTNDGENIGDEVYEDLFGSNESNPNARNRTLFNIFYVKGRRYGQIPGLPGEAKTHVSAYEDGGAYVFMRGEALEDAYWVEKKQKLVAKWTRSITYLRPDLFVVDDRTEAGDAKSDQWLAFHVAGKLVPHAAARHGAAHAAGKRFDVAARSGFVGALTTVLPLGAQTRDVDVLGKHKVHRLEVRPARAGAKQRWLTVADAALRPGEVRTAEPIAGSAGNVLVGAAVGVSLSRDDESHVVVSVGDELGDATPHGAAASASRVTYEVAAKPTVHVITDVRADTDYAVEVDATGGKHRVTVRPGAGRRSSPAGVLTFRVEAEGALAGR